MVDLLKLEVPKLFAVEGGGEEDETVGRVFPVISRLNSQNGPKTLGVNAEHWNGEQINDFVHKLGFLDA